MRDKNINIISLKYDLKSLRHAFSTHRNRSTMQQKLFQNFFIPRSWSFWKHHKKGIAKATPKIEKIYIVNIHREYLLCPQSKASGSVL